MRCAGTDPRQPALPGASPQRETALSHARRPEHRASDTRRTRAQQAGAVEARIVFGRGGTRVPTSQGGICGVQCQAAGAPRGIVQPHATTAETATIGTEKRAAQAPLSRNGLILRGAWGSSAKTAGSRCRPDLATADKSQWQALYVIGTNLAIIQTNLSNLPQASSD